MSAVTSGVPHASAWNALFGITRAALPDVPKIPSAQPARCSSPGSRSYSTHGTCSTFGGAVAEQRVELARSDDAERDVGREACRREDRLDALKRDQLADEEDGEPLRRRPAGVEQPLLGADEADREALARRCP